MKPKIDFSSSGQLVSLIHEGVEFFHPGGASNYNGPGWSNSEIVCFPVFGPVLNNLVQVGESEFVLDQHGISRHMPFKIERTEEIVLYQEYSGKNIPNSKWKEGSHRPETLNWMSYRLEKKFEPVDDGLIVSLTVENKSERVMPFMIGWHPAFKVNGPVEEGIFYYGKNDGNSITLLEVIKASNMPPNEAYLLPDTSMIKYVNEKIGITFSSEDFKHAMLWSPSEKSEMFCKEFSAPTLPILPVRKKQYFGDDITNFELLNQGSKNTHAVHIGLMVE
ncbi:MAG: hypothetical protein GON13_02485 [Nanoarchaeota archaeon]|nr:hypothetical protein [Nanoarchaeota archaeon]